MSKVKCNKVIFGLRDIIRKIEDLKDDAAFISFKTGYDLTEAMKWCQKVINTMIDEREKLAETKQ